MITIKMYEDLIEKLFSIRGYEKEDPSIKVFCVEVLMIGDLESFLKEGCSDQVRKLIIICESNKVNQKKVSFYQSLCDLDVFETKGLSLLLGGHRLVPRHEKLCAQERLDIISKYGLQNLPRLCISDPMCKLHDFKIDDIVKITRPRGIYYRRVIED